MRLLTTVLLISTLFIAGCRSAPKVQDIPRTMITSGKTVEEVEQIIERTVKARGWAISDKKPGEMTATIRARQHSATVLIKYDKDGYTINYVDSANLNYDKSDNTIHGKYNRWVRTLDKDIRSQL